MARVNTTPSVILWARDARLGRALDVIKTYQISSGPAERGWRVFHLTGGTEPYVVRVHPEWADSPTCSCPDATGFSVERNAGYCKHMIAVLLSDDGLRGQLLELFL